jgi:hypothetical protein
MYREHHPRQKRTDLPPKGIGSCNDLALRYYQIIQMGGNNREIIVN